ncbi:MAG: UvrD-helicase domain-containing protein [Deltaproteobacteria bacterium]|nr:UvrD-helicase domain-containing protein [Deltaproteobacteria bacterium]
MVEQLTDSAARERIAQAIDESQFVEAAAGTGKTHVLIDRIEAVIRSGAGELASMVVVTFTEKAAGELKLRIRRRLRDALGQLEGEQHRRVLDALYQFERAQVSTIHGFCADLLREYPLAAGVDPDFEVLGDAIGSRRLFDRVFFDWFNRRRPEEASALAIVLSRNERRCFDRLRDAAWRFAEHCELAAAWQDQAAPSEQLGQWLIAQILAVADAGYALVRAGGVEEGRLSVLLDTAGELRALEQATQHQLDRRFDRLCRELPYLIRRLGRRGKLAPLTAQLTQLQGELERYQLTVGAHLAPELRGELMAVVRSYQHEKLRAAKLDFTDLLRLTRQMLERDASLRRALRQRFSHFFVDEFQDTDPLQAEIIFCLAAPAEAEAVDAAPGAGRLFVVGDPKQSIYRFRRAEIELYQRAKARLAALPEQTMRSAVLELSTSYRAVPDIQHAVNAAFSPLLVEGDGQPGYVPLCPHRPAIPWVDGMSTASDAPQAVAARQPALLALPLSPAGLPERLAACRAREPAAVAALIAQLIGSGHYRVRGTAGTLVPLAAEHFCLLFRRLRAGGRDLSLPYAEALRRWGIAHGIAGTQAFFWRDEIEVLRHALRAIEWPDDQLAIYATLHGPLFGLDDESLLLYQQAGGRFDARLAEQGDCEGFDPRIVQALRLMNRLHRGRNRRPLADTIGRLLAATRAMTMFHLRPDGELAVAAVDRLLDLARAFEQTDALSFRAFVDYLDQQADSAASDDGGSISRGGVQMMTVHRAKGLQFPVVVLVDVATTANTRLPSSASDRAAGLYAQEICGCRPNELLVRQDAELAKQQAEDVRLLYVAATRAQDILVLPLPADGLPKESWLAPLSPVFEGAVRLTSGLPGGAARSVDDGMLIGQAGLYRPRRGEHHVLWWDFEQLQAEAPRQAPIRHYALLERDGPQASQSVERYATWQSRADADRLQLQQPLCRWRAATEVAHRGASWASAAADAVEIWEVERADQLTVGGLRYGNLMHRALEFLDFDRAVDDTAYRRAIIASAADELCASQAERALADQQLAKTVAHPLMQRARRAKALYREAPIAFLFGEEPTLVDGIVDLVFVDQHDCLHVVDYKTDSQPTLGQIAAYRRQVALYLDCLRVLSDGRVRGHLLFV